MGLIDHDFETDIIVGVSYHQRNVCLLRLSGGEKDDMRLHVGDLHFTYFDTYDVTPFETRYS